MLSLRKVACMKAAKCSPKSVSIFDAATLISVLKTVRNIQRIKKESHNDIERNYLILLHLCLL
jgi:hypothetical protein